ncbi:MAG: hypothetical protein WKF47_02955 [Geodermatophilaceae bacterium]
MDVTIQAQILELLKALVVESGTALLMITHDLGVVAGLCDRVNVLYAGRVDRVGRASRAVRQRPRTPTRPVCSPRCRAWTHPRGAPLLPIRGSARDAIPWTDGCAFAPRCDHLIDACLGRPPELEDLDGAHQLRCCNPTTVRPVEVLA